MDELVELLDAKFLDADFDSVDILESQLRQFLINEYGNNIYITSDIEDSAYGSIEIQFSENIPGDNLDQSFIIVEFSFIDPYQPELIVEDIYWEYKDA